MAVKFALKNIITIFAYLESVFDSCFKAKEAKKQMKLLPSTLLQFFLSLKLTTSDTCNNRLPVNT